MITTSRFLAAAAAGLLLAGCGDASKPAPPEPEPPEPPATPTPTPRVVETADGTATWYEVPEGSLAERRSSDDDGLTAAHRDLPIGTEVRVENKETGEQVTVEVTDRGIGSDPVIDVSKEAAEELEMVEEGKVPVTIEVLEDQEPVGRE